MHFSLVVATLGRDAELRELFDSLEQQTFRDFDLIVVDQNGDDRLAWTEEKGRYTFPVTRLRSKVRKLSHARNVGLRAVRGEILSFPDDDCTYPADLLETVHRAFLTDSRLVVRTGPAANPAGGLGSGRWASAPAAITLSNVWTCAIAFNMFIRRDVCLDISGFDERLGVGAEYGAAEDTDLVLRAVQAGGLGWYDTRQLVRHPDKAMTDVAVKRAFTYGAGFGYVLRKHPFPLRVRAEFLARPLLGCMLSLARCKLASAKYYWMTLLGRLYGISSVTTVTSLVLTVLPFDPVLA